MNTEYSDKEWNDIDEKFNCETEDAEGWKNFPVEYCGNQPPSRREILKNFQSSSEDTEGWKQSTHPYCKSCYGLYSQVCDSVAEVSGIPNGSKKINSWKKEDLTLMIEGISNLVKTNNFEVKPLISKVVPMLNEISNCIQTRWYHFGKCYFNNDLSHPSLVKADEKHMSFITSLCKNILKLQTLYKGLIFLLQFIEEPNLKDFALTDEVSFNICRHQLKQFGDQSELQDLNYLETNTQRSRRVAKSPNKNKERNRDQSRINSGYIVSQEKIIDIIKSVKSKKASYHVKTRSKTKK